MADQASGSGASCSHSTARKHTKLSLQDVLDAVLDSSNESSDSEFADDSSMEEFSDEEEEVPLEFVSGEPCERSSWLLLDVSFITLDLFLLSSWK